MATLLNTNAHFTEHSAQLSGVLPSRLSGTLILQSLILVRLYLFAPGPPSAYRGTATFPRFLVLILTVPFVAVVTQHELAAVQSLPSAAAQNWSLTGNGVMNMRP
jgi:hypothetical protein